MIESIQFAGRVFVVLNVLFMLVLAWYIIKDMSKETYRASLIEWAVIGLAMGGFIGLFLIW